MDQYLFEGELFKDNDKFTTVLEKEFLECEFENYLFSNIQDSNFVDCEFKKCDFSNLNLKYCRFSNYKFAECKMIGTNFSLVQKFEDIIFEECFFHLASFLELKCINLIFKNSIIKEVDFRGAYLVKSQFVDSNLEYSEFDHADLSSSDFSTAYSYSINPLVTKVGNAKFSLPEAMGLLKDFGIKII